jgi:hypothetical protein
MDAYFPGQTRRVLVFPENGDETYTSYVDVGSRAAVSAAFFDDRQVNLVRVKRFHSRQKPSTIELAAYVLDRSCIEIYDGSPEAPPPPCINRLLHAFHGPVVGVLVSREHDDDCGDGYSVRMRATYSIRHTGQDAFLTEAYVDSTSTGLLFGTQHSSRLLTNSKG